VILSQILFLGLQLFFIFVFQVKKLPKNKNKRLLITETLVFLMSLLYNLLKKQGGCVMNINAIMLRPEDNVATVVNDVKAGDTVSFSKNGEQCVIKAAESIPAYHKIAVSDLKKGDHIIKYGQIIGGLTVDEVKKGCWISHKNIMSLPRNYEDEL
jgi:altronate dehydratase